MLATASHAPACCMCTSPLSAVLVGAIVLAEQCDARPAFDEPCASYAHLLRQVEEVVGELRARTSDHGSIVVRLIETVSDDASLRVMPSASLDESAVAILDNTLLSMSISWEEWDRVADDKMVVERFRTRSSGGHQRGLLFGGRKHIASARRVAGELGFALDPQTLALLPRRLDDDLESVRARAQEADRFVEVLRSVRPELATRAPHEVMRGAGWPSALSSTIFVSYPADTRLDDEIMRWRTVLEHARSRGGPGHANGCSTTVRAIASEGPPSRLSYVRVDLGDDAPPLCLELSRLGA